MGISNSSDCKSKSKQARDLGCFGIWGLGFWDLGFRVLGLGFWDLGFRVLGFRVQDLSWVFASSDYCCSWNCAGTLTQWVLWCWILHENDNHCVIAYVTKS